MTHFRRIALLAMLGCGANAAAAGVETRPEANAGTEKGISARCQVWARELSFARSVADHDEAAFANHLHDAAAFGVGRQPILGRAAVVRAWKGIVDGSALRLAWYPDRVTLGGDGSIAYSSGPALTQDPTTGQYRRSRFGSVWQRGDEGVWRVVFDDGSSPEPADAEAVRAFHAGRREQCPEA